MIEFPSGAFAGLDPEVGEPLAARVASILAALRAQDYDVLVSNDLEDLKSFEYEHPEYSTPNTALDPKFHPNDRGAQGVFLTHQGRRVGTLWRRVIPLLDKRFLRKLDLKEAFEGLHIFYDDPLDAPRREKCTLPKTFPRMIKGSAICYSGWAWNHPAHRRDGLFRGIADLLRALALVAPDPWEWYISLVCKTRIEKAIESFAHDTFTRHLTHNGRPYWLLAMSYEEVVERALRGTE